MAGRRGGNTGLRKSSHDRKWTIEDGKHRQRGVIELFKSFKNGQTNKNRDRGRHQHIVQEATGRHVAVLNELRRLGQLVTRR